MHFLKHLTQLSILGIVALISSCNIQEDPGPLQYGERPYAITDFDRLDIGDAMYVTVTEGNLFSIVVAGDRRNLDDLEVVKVGNTLVTRFARNRNRKHTTYITITMPSLQSANFYGAATSAISGFETDNLKLNLSGASVAQIDIETVSGQFVLSGASNLSLSGTSVDLSIDLSGASLLKSYNMNADNVNLVASGASHAYVKANQTLVAEASGASSIFYRGDATVTTKTSGASSIVKD